MVTKANETHPNELMNIVFNELVSTLEDKEIKLICGTYKGRFYERFISIESLKDWQSGTCYSYKWFEKDENPVCPIKDSCGAYARAKKTS